MRTVHDECGMSSLHIRNTISGRDQNAYATTELVTAFGRYTATCNWRCTTDRIFLLDGDWRYGRISRRIGPYRTWLVRHAPSSMSLSATLHHTYHHGAEHSRRFDLSKSTTLIRGV